MVTDDEIGFGLIKSQPHVSSSHAFSSVITFLVVVCVLSGLMWIQTWDLQQLASPDSAFDMLSLYVCLHLVTH